MSDQNSQQEPSMEEILASIRRIISEDGEEEGAAPEEAVAEEAVEAAEPEPEAADEPVAEEPVEEEPAPEEPEADEEEVLELTDEVQDDGTVVNLKTGETVDEESDEFDEGGEDIELEMLDPEEGEPETEAEPEPEPKPEPEPETELVEEVAAVATAAVTEERLVSQTPGMDSVSSLSALAAAVDDHRRAVDPSIGPRTIEDLVKEVMRPMIREWLDDNLPSLVERLVGREIERLTREAEDISQR